FQEIPIRVGVPKISSEALQLENFKIIRSSRCSSKGSLPERLSSDSELDDDEQSAIHFVPELLTSSACASTGSFPPRKVSQNFGPSQDDNAGDESTSDFKPDDDDDDDSNSTTHSEDSEDEEYEPTRKSIMKMKRQPNFRHNPGEKRKLGLPPSAISDPSSQSFYTSFCKGHKKMFKCSLCSAERIMRRRMIAHLTLHEKGEGSNCSHCGWLVVTGYMSRHISRYHPETETKVGKPKKEKRVYSYNCSKCPARSNDKAFMDTHLPLHEPSNEEPCTFCELCGWLVKTDRMESHLASPHHSRRKKKPKKIREIPSGTPFYCDHCHFILPRMKYLQLHFRRNHADSEELVACIQPTCEEKFESKQLLKFHLEEAHRDIHIQEEVQQEEGDQICKYCKLQFNSKMDVDYHIAKKHKDMLVTCTTCNVNLKSYCLYRQHMESKAHGASPMYSCELCGKTYHTDIALQGHRRQDHFAEMGLEPIKCEECGLITSNNQQLRYHIKLVHNKVRKYWCEFCGQAFGDRKGLESHLRSFHKGPLGTPVLPSGKHFRLEKKSENGEESWLCDFCTGIFSNLMAVRTHLLNTHYEQLSHVCEGCGKKFWTT
ncbi:Zinc finger and BTB domain-containing protein 48, partial [Orchesella cincta]